MIGIYQISYDINTWPKELITFMKIDHGEKVFEYSYYDKTVLRIERLSITLKELNDKIKALNLPESQKYIVLDLFGDYDGDVTINVKVNRIETKEEYDARIRDRFRRTMYNLQRFRPDKYHAIISQFELAPKEAGPTT